MKQILTLYIFLFAFLSKSSIRQVKKTLHFSSESGMHCSQTIILDSTGLFFNESGCEGRANISFGRYKFDKDKRVKFQYLPFDSIKPIARIIQEKKTKENDSLITITFYDRYNNPLGFNFGIRLGDTSNQVHEMWTDENGQVQIKCLLFKYVSLVQFLAMYRETDGIEIGQNSLKVYLNLPAQFLMYPELEFDRPRKLNLQLKQKGLYDIELKKICYRLD